MNADEPAPGLSAIAELFAPPEFLSAPPLSPLEAEELRLCIRPGDAAAWARAVLFRLLSGRSDSVAPRGLSQWMADRLSTLTERERMALYLGDPVPQGLTARALIEAYVSQLNQG